MLDLTQPLTFNERRLFELVLRGKDASRTAIAEATGLTPTTVSRLVSRLVDAGVLSDVAERSGRLGQPRRSLSINAGQAFSVGVNFIRGRFDIAIVDLAGSIVWQETTQVVELTAESVAELAASSVERALSAKRVSRKRIIGVGFSLPGGFAPDGKVLLAHELFPELDNRDLSPIFSDALGLNVSFDTDGACATLGEFLFGGATAHETTFLIHIGHGVGGGAIIDGRLFRGAHGNASKPGALFPYNLPRPSGQDLVEWMNEHETSVSDLADLAEYEPTDPVIEAWMDRAALQIAEAGRMVTAFIDPEVIFVGGRLPSSFNRALISRLAETSLPGPSRNLPNAPFRASTLGPSSGVLGAASLPIFEYFFPGAQVNLGNAYINGRRSAASQGAVRPMRTSLW